MAIEKTKCPHCQNEISVASELNGMSVNCPSCNNSFIYTAPAAAPVVTPVTPAAPVVTPVTPAAPGVVPGVVPGVAPAAEEPKKATMFTALGNYFNFTGRANRREFWLFQLFSTLIYGLCVIFGMAAFMMDSPEVAIVFDIIMGIWALASFIPTLSVTIRRFHDTGSSWAYIFCYFIPCVGGLLIFFKLCSGSAPDNKWGKNPNGGGKGELWPCLLCLGLNVLLGIIVAAAMVFGAIRAISAIIPGLDFGNPITEHQNAKRVALCENNLKQIGNGIEMYKQSNKYNAPDSLEQLVEGGYIPEDILKCEGVKYVYLGAGLGREFESGLPIAVCGNGNHTKETLVLFADGHVEKTSRGVLQIIEANGLSDTKAGKIVRKNYESAY